jgi:hypothetical protein
MSLEDSLRVARSEIGRDNKLAAYLVRDLPETVAVGLRDLAWTMADWKTGWVSDDEATWLLAELENRWARKVQE